MPESLLSQSSASNNVTVCAESSPSEQIPKVSEEPNSHDTTRGSKVLTFHKVAFVKEDS